MKASLPGTYDLFVGVPDPSVLFVVGSSNTKAIARPRQAILTPYCLDSVAMTPAYYRLTAARLELIAARSDTATGG
jgi:hypothetical protein